MLVAVRNAELFYSTRGQGPACLVMSLMGTTPYERQIPTALSDRLRVVFVDLRGSGRSTGDLAGFSFDQLAEDLEAVRQDLGEPRVAVLGHSILGSLAIEYGRRCSSTVSRVITVGTPPRGDMAWLTAQARVFFERDASEERKALLRENLARLPANASFAQGLAAQVPVRFFDAHTDLASLYAGAVFNPAILAHVASSPTQNWDVTTDIDSLGVPTLLAHGRYDYAVPYTLWDGVASRIPNATFRLFERSGHQPFCEEPEAFVDAVTSWMGLTT